jgi:transcriptional regulator with PAS, ATPase and Fis domain
MTPPKGPDDLLLQFWKAGQREQARILEMNTRAGVPGIKMFSTYTEEWLDKYIGHSSYVQQLKVTVRKLQAEDDSVLIIGDSGTGKELIARALHGSRSGKFIGVNCTALPSEMIESELFGHKKGSFTGATDDRPGKIQAAWGGTLFLDEIGDMPPDMQAKLLRVLQEREYSPVGEDNKVMKVNCRIVAATNKRIDELLLHTFRTDLYWRLSTFIIKTIPLHERTEDIADIVDSLGGSTLYDKFAKYHAEPTANDYIEFFDLRGNIRSLQAQVRRWLVLGVSDKDC